MVTAFALGHPTTLVLGALGCVHLPSRVVESGIALSVLVSAVHAIRPLVRRGEVLIAASFGLLHGLSFATLLGQLDLSRSNLVITLLGFNLGIEIAQLLVVALVMPFFKLLARTTIYPFLRTSTATLGAIVALGWFAERSHPPRYSQRSLSTCSTSRNDRWEAPPRPCSAAQGARSADAGVQAAHRQPGPTRTSGQW